MMTDEILKEQSNNLVHQQTLEDKDESAKNQDFLQNNNVVEEKVVLRLYTTTRIKARISLSNIAYNSVNDLTILNRNFFFDSYVLVTKNLNPLSMERKITDQSKHGATYMI